MQREDDDFEVGNPDFTLTITLAITRVHRETAPEIAYEYFRKPHVKAPIEQRKPELMAAKKMT